MISLMIGNALTNLEKKYAPPMDFNLTDYENSSDVEVAPNANDFLSMDREKARILIVMANSFGVGVIQIVMFFFQLGFVSSYMSEPLVNGFLSASAFHVVTSQLPLIFGVRLKSYSGAFKIPKTMIEFFRKLHRIHWPTICVSAICMTILLVVKIHINERFRKKLPGNYHVVVFLY